MTNLRRKHSGNSDSGSTALEYVAMLPLFSFVVLLALQAFVAVTVASSAEDAARAAAQARARGGSPETAAQGALPSWLSDNVQDVEVVQDGSLYRVEVDISVPILLSAFTGTTATGRATMGRT